MPSLFLLVAMFNLTLIVAGLKELIVDDLGGRIRDASLFFSIEMIAYIVFAPIWGVVSDRIGRRRPLITLGFLASGVLYAAFAVVDSIELLLVLRFVQGVASVMAWSTLMALVLDQPDVVHRGRNLGVMGAALIFGVSLGAPIGGMLSSAVGVRAPLVVAAILFGLLSVASLWLDDSVRPKRLVTASEILRAVSRRPRLLLPYFFYFADRYTVGVIVVLLPLYLESLGVEDPAVRGRYLAAFLLPFALLQSVTGRIADVLGPYRPLIVGSLLYGLFLCTVGFTGLFPLWSVMFALGVLASIMFPPAISLTAEYSDPETRGSAMGGFNVAGSLGFAVGPLAGTWAFEAYGYGSSFVIAGALEIAAALAALVLLWRWGTWSEHGRLEP